MNIENNRYIIGWLNSYYLDKVNENAVMKFLSTYPKIHPENTISAKTKDEANNYYDMLSKTDGDFGFLLDKASSKVIYRKLQ